MYCAFRTLLNEWRESTDAKGTNYLARTISSSSTATRANKEVALPKRSMSTPDKVVVFVSLLFGV